MLVWALPLSAQQGRTTSTATSTNPDAGVQVNPPPFDFNDNFYTANGIDVSELDTSGAGRFGLFRLTAPLARGIQVNWVVDNSNTHSSRSYFRILASTGGYVDDGT